ncbi:hypothetical protein GCM10009809_38240 [Isoptericola hypogeus]|uniref:Uncharacterized protein n=1 Tax=Isoptericola hypogeus TaxID=300179 RepID=A0ABN2JU75_9MICO
MRSEDSAALIREAFDAWAVRITDPERFGAVLPGSVLAAQQAPDLPGERDLPKMAWRSMANAGEHVAAANHVIATGSVLVKPFLTLARTTMIGAARTLYLLEPDEPDQRCIHALRLLRTESKDVDRLIGVWEAEVGRPANPDLRKLADDLRTETENALIQMGENPRSEMADAALLSHAAKRLSHLPGDPLARLMELWNFSSGNAHARTWTWDMGLERGKDYAGQFARVWSLPMYLMDEAWELWNERRGATRT